MSEQMDYEKSLESVGFELDDLLEPIQPWDEKRFSQVEDRLSKARKHVGPASLPQHWPAHDALDDIEHLLIEVRRLQAVANALPEIYQRLSDLEGGYRLLVRLYGSKPGGSGLIGQGEGSE